MGTAERFTVDQGLSLVRRSIRRLGHETVPIEAALGRVIAQPITANYNVPNFRAAAMDGYAVRSADIASASTENPVLLPVSAQAPAGTAPPPLEAGTTCSISTGAPVPEGADSIVMREHIVAQNNAGIVFSSPARPGSNIRKVGEDAMEGQTVIGTRILVSPDIIAALAAYGHSQVDVVRSPKLALIVTGSELAATGAPRRNASIVDSNGPMIRAYAASIGMAIRSIGPVTDGVEALDAALDAPIGSDADMILTSGGASHGDHDLVRNALDRRGADIVFHGLSMRPGKPILFAILPDGRPFFGLPGNPVSSAIAMRFFVGQALRAMLGLPDEIPLPLSSHAEGREGITLFLRGRQIRHADGQSSIDLTLDQRSHILSSLINADVWLKVDRIDGQVKCAVYPKPLRLEV